MEYDVCVLGAGAAGLMAALTAGARGRRVLVLDSSNKPGKKILMSGGGRCNFTNLDITPENYLSANPHFAKSALARYTQWDFIALVEKHGIPWFEKKLGQLFCERSSRDILEMLLAECEAVDVKILTHCEIHRMDRADRAPADATDTDGFVLQTSFGPVRCVSLVVATGGLSIPKVGATGFGYALAGQFGLDVRQTSAALVPFVFDGPWRALCERLAGVALDVRAEAADASMAVDGSAAFDEAILFSHRGLTGPAALQISSYWQPGGAIRLDLLPGQMLVDALRGLKVSAPTRTIRKALLEFLPRKLTDTLLDHLAPPKRLRGLGEWSDAEIMGLSNTLHGLALHPSGTEGYRTAEVTLGGLQTSELSSKTMESHKVPGLYFIGEVVDVTGHLGGYNFQWACSSGVAAGDVA